MTMPEQKPGRSRQDYGTPRVFLDAVERRFGRITCDLACDDTNRVCAFGFTEQQNSLAQTWPDRGVNWLNPPFEDIEPWAIKCCSVRDNPAWTLMLVPGGIGTEWCRLWVRPAAHVLGVNPRITFVGERHSYPKDMMLCAYGYGVVGFDVWRWKRGRDGRKTESLGRGADRKARGHEGSESGASAAGGGAAILLGRDSGGGAEPEGT